MSEKHESIPLIHVKYFVAETISLNVIFKEHFSVKKEPADSIQKIIYLKLEDVLY